MQRLETRHWIIIAIMVIVIGAMGFDVPLTDLKEILMALGTLGALDFGVKRYRESKENPTIIK